jgi:phosphosulfolactate phosphohydrolase-like enzyme
MNVSRKTNNIAHEDMLFCGKIHAMIWDSMNKELTTLK